MIKLPWQHKKSEQGPKKIEPLIEEAQRERDRAHALLNRLLPPIDPNDQFSAKEPPRCGHIC